MSKVYEIAFKMGGQISGTFTKAMKGAEHSLGGLQKQISHLNKEQKDIGSLKDLQMSVGKLSREFTQAQATAQRLGRELASTTNPTKKQTAEFEQARKASVKLKTKLAEQRQELKELRTTLNASGQSYRDLTARQKELARSAEKAQQAQASLQKTMLAQQKNTQKRDNLRGQLFDAAGLAFALAAPIKMAAQFEQSMANVGAVANATDQEMAQLTATARQLGSTTNWSASQAAEGMKFLAQAGFDTQQTMKAMPGMLDLASAGAIDLGQAADIASNILSGFKLNAGEMARVGDVMTNTFTSSNTNLSMLGETMKYVAPIASSASVPLEQVAAMAGKLGDAGVQGSEAGTALRAVIARLSAPSKTAAKALDELGISTKDAEGNLRDVPTVLAEIQKATQGMGSAARLEYTKTIFETEAMSAATILMEQSASGALQKYEESLYKAGSATEVARKQNETAMGAMRRLSSAAESIAITMGNVLLPTLADGAQKFANVIGVVDGLSKQFPLLTKIVITGTAALIALKVATIAGGFAFTYVKGVWLGAVAILKTLRAAYLLSTGATIAATNATKSAIVVSKAFTAAQWLFNAALAANPIGLVIVAITALIAAGVALYRNWDKVTAGFGKMWGNIKSWTTQGIQWLSNVFMNFHPLGFLINNFGAIDKWLSNFSLYNSGKKIISTLASGIMSKAQDLINSVKGIFAKVREYMPFSDAKVGPFSDLTKSGAAIMSTLAEGANGEQSLQQAMAGQMQSSRGGLLQSAENAAGGAGGGSIVVHLQQNISIPGGDNAAIREQAAAGAREGVEGFESKLNELMNRRRRLSYG